MKRIIVESPFMYRSGNPGERNVGLLRNVTYARLAARDCLLRGESPYASHLIFTQTHVLDDDVPEERELGIKAGLEWGELADASAIYGDLGISKGMEYGIERARIARRPCLDRTLPGWAAASSETPFETLLRLELFDEATLEAVRDGLGVFGPAGLMVQANVAGQAPGMG